MSNQMADAARDEILRAVESITASGRDTFTVDEVVREMQVRGTHFAESTIRTHITSRMCANAPKNHGTTYADFERVSRGEYRLVK
jgi:hypothetical protein